MNLFIRIGVIFLFSFFKPRSFICDFLSNRWMQVFFGTVMYPLDFADERRLAIVRNTSRTLRYISV